MYLCTAFTPEYRVVKHNMSNLIIPYLNGHQIFPEKSWLLISYRGDRIHTSNIHISFDTYFPPFPKRKYSNYSIIFTHKYQGCFLLANHCTWAIRSTEFLHCFTKDSILSFHRCLFVAFKVTFKCKFSSSVHNSLYCLKSRTDKSAVFSHLGRKCSQIKLMYENC